ncbi:hypothetical protein C8J57DRAFT_1223508 [Mycena rebaudengoi]|nr:hypothetical protein C8J57DRAFT_1223508 [Mycena rebaudengoi]
MGSHGGAEAVSAGDLWWARAIPAVNSPLACMGSIFLIAVHYEAKGRICVEQSRSWMHTGTDGEKAHGLRNDPYCNSVCVTPRVSPPLDRTGFASLQGPSDPYGDRAAGRSAVGGVDNHIGSVTGVVLDAERGKVAEQSRSRFLSAVYSSCRDSSIAPIGFATPQVLLAGLRKCYWPEMRSSDPKRCARRCMPAYIYIYIYSAATRPSQQRRGFIAAISESALVLGYKATLTKRRHPEDAETLTNDFASNSAVPSKDLEGSDDEMDTHNAEELEQPQALATSNDIAISGDLESIAYSGPACTSKPWLEEETEFCDD